MRAGEFSKTFFDECCHCERQGSLVSRLLKQKGIRIENILYIRYCMQGMKCKKDRFSASYFQSFGPLEGSKSSK